MNSKNASLLGYLGAGVVLVAFFLPFVQISILGISWSANGYQLASGNVPGVDGADVMGTGSASYFWLFVAAAVAVIVANAVLAKNMGAKKVGIFSLCSGLLIAGLWGIKMLDLNSAVSKLNEQMSTYGSLLGDSVTKFSLFNIVGIGFWGILVGSILIVASGLLMKSEASVNTPQVPPMEPPIVPPAAPPVA